MGDCYVWACDHNSGDRSICLVAKTHQRAQLCWLIGSRIMLFTRFSNSPSLCGFSIRLSFNTSSFSWMTSISKIKTLSTRRANNYLVKDCLSNWFCHYYHLCGLQCPAHLFIKFSPQIKSEGIELDGIVLKRKKLAICSASIFITSHLLWAGRYPWWDSELYISSILIDKD